MEEEVQGLLAKQAPSLQGSIHKLAISGSEEGRFGYQFKATDWVCKEVTHQDERILDGGGPATVMIAGCVP